MPDTLSTFSVAMGLIPDNTARLIAPDDQRSVAISLLPDRGGAVGDPGPWVIPIAAVDVWVDIPQAISGDMVPGEGALFWRMDVNGHLAYDYAADWPTIVVPPGHLRNVRFVGEVDIDPNNNVWQFAMAIAGVPQTPFITVDDASTTDALAVIILAGVLMDVSAAEIVSLQVRNQSNTDDLELNAIEYGVTGGPLA